MIYLRTSYQWCQQSLKYKFFIFFRSFSHQFILFFNLGTTIESGTNSTRCYEYITRWNL